MLDAQLLFRCQLFEVGNALDDDQDVRAANPYVQNPR